MSKNNEQRSNKNVYLRIMLMVNIAFILLLVTLAVIALKVTNVLPDGADILYVVGKSPSYEVGDDSGKEWQSNTEINIFKTEYKNGNNEVTVISQNGDKVIAPGTTSTYRFAMYNNGNMAVVYEADIDFELLISGVANDKMVFPLQLRLYNDQGKYLIGSDTEWESVNDITIEQHVSTLGASSYESFTLEIRWEYEGGNDELDTLLGNMSADNESGIEINLGINTYAEEHVDSGALGGTVIYDEDGNTAAQAGTIRWLWLILLFVNILMIVFYVSWLLNRRTSKNEKEE